MIGSKTNTGIYTIVHHEGVYKVLIILHNNAKKPLEISVTFPNEPDARTFMETNEPNLMYADNKGFSIVHQLGTFE